MATQQQLQEAEAALHKLITGKQVVSVTIDGVQTQYTPAQVPVLRAYVNELRAELGVGVTNRCRPARVVG
ncbi:MAG TPA: gpW family head-tail joining protein [Hyphomicrobiales bacterium]|nr:gpW family head-tail joining protein [Hyphomicrobiales bacterium]